MEKSNQVQSLEPGVLCEFPDTICIPRTRYDELLRSKSELAILRRAYQTTSSFSMDYIMDNIFDPALKYKPKAAPGAEAGPEESAAGAE